MHNLAKNLLIVPLLFAGAIFFHPKQVTKVFICDNGKTTKYHLRNDCRGLNRCTHRIVEMKLDDAKKSGMTLCGFEK